MYRFSTKLAIFRVVIALFLASSVPIQAYAQTPSKSDMSAIMVVISAILLDEEEVFLELNLDDSDERTYNVREEFRVSFPSVGSDIELCFILTNRSNLQDPGLQVSINGVNQNVKSGENCFPLSPAQQQASNELLFLVNQQGSSISLRRISLELADQEKLGLASLTRSSWDEKAVRKVLKIFAFGGHARRSQIIEWSQMQPAAAIAEMLNFAEHNYRLSPQARYERYPITASQYGTLTDFVNYLSSPDSDLPIPLDRREQYGLMMYNFDAAFARMVTTRGLNPFRQKIGYWETNYHLAVNLDASVNGAQLALLYDRIMAQHEEGQRYRDVMGAAAASAAVAMQYGHRNNRWINGECECNEDFAREIHQLYFGIFGLDDPNHEDVTIVNTARMLTDMEVRYRDNFGFSTSVNFGTDEHHVGSLQILGSTIVGTNARAKINNLMRVSSRHPEALKNLPIMIISGLADDNLDESKSNQLRAAWAALGPNKSFLEFIHAYAISDLFHGPGQFKYMTSHERALYRANKFNIDNTEAYIGGNFYGDYSAGGGVAGLLIDQIIERDGAGPIFRPLHNVFGGQTPLEAADSAIAFENNYNRSTEDEYHVRIAAQCQICANGEAWEKDWASVLPRRADGTYRVADAAEWLWNHIDGSLDNYSLLERAHLHSIMGAVRHAPSRPWHQDHFLDFPLLVCVAQDYDSKVSNANLSLRNLMSEGVFGRYCRQDDDGGEYTDIELTALNRAFTGEDIQADSRIMALVNSAGNSRLALESGSAIQRRRAIERINSAVSFIFATPFIFAEGISE